MSRHPVGPDTAATNIRGGAQATRHVDPSRHHPLPIDPIAFTRLPTAYRFVSSSGKRFVPKNPGPTHPASRLDAFRLADQAARRFENPAAGFRALRKWMGKAPAARIGFEPPGPYLKALKAALGETFPCATKEFSRHSRH